jgi:Mitochondrial carrier protein
MYPTDVVKTRQQLGSGKTIGMIQQFRDIIKLEGFGNLYRGMPSLVHAVVARNNNNVAISEARIYFARSDSQLLRFLVLDAMRCIDVVMHQVRLCVQKSVGQTKCIMLIYNTRKLCCAAQALHRRSSLKRRSGLSSSL